MKQFLYGTYKLTVLFNLTMSQPMRTGRANEPLDRTCRTGAWETGWSSVQCTSWSMWYSSAARNKRQTHGRQQQTKYRLQHCLEWVMRVSNSLQTML